MLIGEPGARSRDDDMLSASPMGLFAECLLESVGYAKHRRLVEMIGEDLTSDRQTVNSPNRHRHRWNAGEISGRGENIHQVHLIRFADRPDWKRGGWRGRREQDVYAVGEDVRKIARDQLPDFLRFLVVGVVVACRENVRTEQHAAGNLRAKSGGARRLV